MITFIGKFGQYKAISDFSPSLDTVTKKGEMSEPNANRLRKTETQKVNECAEVEDT